MRLFAFGGRPLSCTSFVVHKIHKIHKKTSRKIGLDKTMKPILWVHSRDDVA